MFWPKQILTVLFTRSEAQSSPHTPSLVPSSPVSRLPSPQSTLRKSPLPPPAPHLLSRVPTCGLGLTSPPSPGSAARLEWSSPTSNATAARPAGAYRSTATHPAPRPRPQAPTLATHSAAPLPAGCGLAGPWRRLPSSAGTRRWGARTLEAPPPDRLALQ